MELSNFINQLLTHGSVHVKPSIFLFDQKDEEEAILLLKKYYNDDTLEMPLLAPDFNEKAGIWAAKYFYIAIQLMVFRDESEELINEKLIAFNGEISPSTMYSADLLFRYLPALLQIAKGLSPADVLVKILKDTAAQWPFSSAGIDLEEMNNEKIIFDHPSLKIAYLDRLMYANDTKRIINNQLQNHISSVAGIHLDIFCPGADTNFKNNS